MRLFLPPILFLVLVACARKQKPIYFWVSYDARGNSDTTLIRRIEVDSFPSGAKTYFYYTSDTTHYFVRPDTLQGSQINLYWPTNKPLRLFFDTILVHNNDTFHVYEFSENVQGFEGKIIHYWDTRFGIYAKHATTWPGITILQTTDTSQNEKLKFLIKQTVPKFILRGKILSDISK